MTEKDYAGSIRNSGTQVVPAPARKNPPKTGSVKQSEKPRSGKK